MIRRVLSPAPQAGAQLSFGDATQQEIVQMHNKPIVLAILPLSR
jgi:hypothetical protein